MRTFKFKNAPYRLSLDRLYENDDSEMDDPWTKIEIIIIIIIATHGVSVNQEQLLLR